MPDQAAKQTQPDAKKESKSPESALENGAFRSAESNSSLLRSIIENPTHDNLTPAVVQLLQRTHGNRFVQGLMRRAANQTTPEETLQRRIAKDFGKTKFFASAAEALKAFSTNTDFKGDYERAKQAGMDDVKDLEPIFTALVQSGEDYTPFDAFRMVRSLIDERVAAQTGAGQRVTTDGGVEISVVNLTAGIEGGQVTDLTPDKWKFDSKWLKIDVSVILRGPAAERQNWSVGFIQTVMSLDRHVFFQNEKGIKYEFIASIPGPTRDGPAGYPGPFYDDNHGVINFSHDFTGSADFEIAQVSIHDKPGFTLNRSARDTFERMEGRDTFKTWLVLRKKDGSKVHYLRLWQWETLYKADPKGSDGSAGSKFTGTSAVGSLNDNGAGAFFGGSIAKDVIKNEYRVSVEGTDPRWRALGSLPTQEDYKAMKKAATRSVTVKSGMLATKKYGAIVAEVKDAIAKSDWNTALGKLTFLTGQLDRMRRASVDSYWKSAALRDQHFQPIYQAVYLQENLVEQKVKEMKGK